MLKDVVERSCAKRQYNIWRSLLRWKMLLKQGSGKRKQDVCLERSCAKRKYNIWRPKLYTERMLMKQGPGKWKHDVLIEAVQRESTISGGLYCAERCCWSRVLERESRMYVLKEAVQRESTISGGLNYILKGCWWSRVLESESMMSWKKLDKEKVQYLEVSTMLKGVVEAGFWKGKQDACLERSCAKLKCRIPWSV